MINSRRDPAKVKKMFCSALYFALLVILQSRVNDRTSRASAMARAGMLALDLNAKRSCSCRFEISPTLSASFAVNAVAATVSSICALLRHSPSRLVTTRAVRLVPVVSVVVIVSTDPGREAPPPSLMSPSLLRSFSPVPPVTLPRLTPRISSIVPLLQISPSPISDGCNTETRCEKSHGWETQSSK